MRPRRRRASTRCCDISWRCATRWAMRPNGGGCTAVSSPALWCEILTDAPPYTTAQKDPKSRQRELWEAARSCATGPAFARLDTNPSRKPAELVAVTKKCLAKEPGKRPGSSAVVAEGVTGY